MSPSPRNAMPSCLRTALLPPSHPTRYCARIVETAPSLRRTVTSTPVASCASDSNAQPYCTETEGSALGFGFEQRLERVLRDELVRLERHRSRRCTPRSRRRATIDRRVRQSQQRRLVQRQHDEDVHRDVGLAAPRPGSSPPGPSGGRSPSSARCSAPSSAGTLARACARRACSGRRGGPRSTASVNPTGPAPTMRTSVCMRA